MAAQFKEDFYVDLVRDKSRQRYGGPILYQGDAKSLVLRIHLYEDGVDYSGGGTVSGTAIRTKDGATVPLTGGSISGNTVTMSLIANCFIAPGAPLNVFVTLSSGSVTTTILCVIYDVLATTTSNVVDPSSEITITVADLVDEIAEARATVPASYTALMSYIAPFYTDLTFPISAYQQLCWYDSVLYVNKVDISASESWTASHWEEVDISGELARRLATDEVATVAETRTYLGLT
jgi:hypothetical protein